MGALQTELRTALSNQKLIIVVCSDAFTVGTLRL
jgi:hypothetical protein